MNASGASGAVAVEEAPPLRVGLLLDRGEAPGWIHRIVSDLREDPAIELALVVRDTEPARWPRRRLLQAAYATLDDALHAHPGDALASRDLAPLLAGVPERPVRAERGESADRLAPADLAAIREQRLDVVLRLGSGPLDAGSAGIARNGVWSLHVGDESETRGGPPGFWEVADAAPCTAVTLWRQDEAGGRVLARSWSLTDTHSVRCSASEVLWKGAALVPRALRALRRGDPAVVAPGEPFRPGDARFLRAPSRARIGAALARIGARWLRERVSRVLYRRQWALAWSTDPTFPPSLSDFQELLPPKDRIWADPFPVERGGRRYLFFEECPAGATRAHLAVMELGADGRWTTPRPVLARPYHLSYPFVFTWGGETWMVPETSENATVELYRCLEFPHRWVLDRILLRGICGCDATLHEHDGAWWMFLSTRAPGARMFDELRLYRAASPLGPWLAAPEDPVVSDVRRARPAGRVFQREGRWIRPAQDGSGRYGRALRFQQIDQLGAAGYAETELAHLAPDGTPGVLGVHTWNTAGTLTVIDFIKQRRRFW